MCHPRVPPRSDCLGLYPLPSAPTRPQEASMTRNLLVALAIACVALGVRPTAQARPDFSGRWALVDPSGFGAFGASFVATQDATTLSVQMTSIDVSMTLGGGATRVDGSPIRRVFSFNGEDNVVTYPRPANIDAMDQTRMMWSYIATSSSRAAWMGDQLVIVTHNKSKVRFPPDTPSDFDSEQTVRLALAFDSDGRRLIASLPHCFISSSAPSRQASGRRRASRSAL